MKKGFTPLQNQDEPERKNFVTGFTLIEILIGVAVLCLLASIIIPYFLRANTASNESAAQVTLKTISAGLEAFAQANKGLYLPYGVASATSDDYLRQKALPYLNKRYCGQVDSGYAFNCMISATGYTLTARPLNCRTAGTKSFTMQAGGVLVTDATCTAAGG